MVRAQALVWARRPVTLPSTEAAAVVPCAACATLRGDRPVAALCCSIDAATAT